MSAPINDTTTSSATWKFQFENTVNADPRAKGACLKVLRVYLDFASKSDPRAFVTMPELMLATACTRPTLKKALQTMERLGYMVPLFTTEGGATMYRLVNARQELVADHIGIARTSLAFDRAEQKRRYRLRRRMKETFSPRPSEGERNLPPKVKETFPNTVEGNRRVSCSEGRGGLIEEDALSSSSFYGPIPDEVPFDIPSDEQEAEIMLDEIRPFIGNVNGPVLASLKRMLMSGELSPAYLSQQFGGGHGAA
ncbi:hypothetical protein ACQKP1_15940 [Allorhizobium sp. NPDC080224]|uniref:hypothetical protein n=1 Tax=Allorhizobium sp. NPDC080224 TaxID=3390547 RepID=UPI003D0400DD